MSLRICWPVISMTSKPQFGGERVKLGDVCTLVLGQSPISSTCNACGQGLPFFQGNADFGRINPEATSWCTEPKKTAEPGDILLSVRAPIGAVNIALEKCCIGRGVAAIRPNSRIIQTDYLKHVLVSYRSQLETKGTGSTFKAVGKKVLSEFEIPICSLNRQSQIENQLNQILDCIENCKMEIEQLDQLVKSRFVEMFGAVNELRPGFTIKTINDVCSSIIRGPFGSALKKSFFVSKGEATYKVYEQKHAIQKRADIGTYYITSEKFDSLKRFECKPGDILMSCSGTMGKLYQLPINCEPGIINQALCKFTLNESVLPDYFFRVMGQIIDELGAKGSGIKNVSSVKYIKAIKIPVPPLFLQQQFADFVAQVDKSGFAVRQQIEKLQLLYDSLAQEYFGD